MEVGHDKMSSDVISLTRLTGYGPKVAQSVLTAAFLFYWKDALYEMTVKARRTMAQRKLAA